MPDPRSPLVLRPDQRDFIDRFSAADTPLRQLLVGPPGAGKSTTAIALIRSSLESSPARVLVVTRLSVVAERLAEASSPQRPMVRITKAWLRERSVEPGDMPSGWPASIVGVIDPATLADQWVTTKLAAIQWSLVVVDDADTLSSEAERSLRRLADQGRAQRLLVLGQPERTSPLRTLHGLEVTTWPSLVVDTSSPAARFGHRFHPVFFDRSQDERALLHQARLLLERPAITAKGWGLGDLQEAATSSPYALQASALRALERLRLLRNALAHGSTGDDVTPHISRAHELRELNLTLQELQALADAVDQLSVDARYTAFITLLNRKEFSVSSTAVFCAQASTAAYLVDGLAIRDRQVTRVSAQRPALSELREALHQPAAVIVVEDEAVGALNLQGAGQAINYDLVPDVDRMHARWAGLGLTDPSRRSPDIWSMIDAGGDEGSERRALELMPYIRGTSD